MKWLILLMACVVLNAASVSAAEYDDMPNVVGMEETDAKNILESYVSTDGETVEVIVKYEYHSALPEGQIINQEIKESAGEGEPVSVVIYVSMGVEPNENLGDVGQADNASAGFGMSEYRVHDDTNSQFGIDWSSLPESFEYNWDNSENCWQWGVWIDGIMHKTARGKYNTDVRHKVQGYCDGTYVYIRLEMSKDFGDRCNGDNYQFWLDRELACFQLRTMEGHNLTEKCAELSVGTQQVQVVHEGSSISGQVAVDALAYITKKPKRHNAVLELRIPLAEMKRQNSRIDLERLGIIEFFTPNLMYRRYRIAGASTFPMVMAAALLVAVPGSTVLIRKYRKKKVKIHD